MAKMLRQMFELQTSEDLGPNRVRAIAVSNSIARDGHIIETSGMDVSAFRRIGVILWNHDADYPVGNPVDVVVNPNTIEVEIEFAPKGASSKADEIRTLVKGGVIRAVSCGFDPKRTEPLDPKKPRGGQRILESELIEISFVACPADVNAVITERDHDGADEWLADALKNTSSAIKALTERSDMTEQNRAAEGMPSTVMTALDDAEERDATPLARIARAIKWVRDLAPDAAGVEVIIEELTEAEAALKREAEPEVTRAGAKHSAATKAALQEAIGHHEAGIQCMRDMMDSDGGDDSGEMSHEPVAVRMTDTLTVQVDASGFRLVEHPERAALAERIRKLRIRGEIDKRAAEFNAAMDCDEAQEQFEAEVA